MAKGFDAFPLWLNDWWGSTARKILSPCGRAAYLELLCTQYSMGSKGLTIIPSTIAANDEHIAKLIAFTLDEWLAVKAEVLQFFDRTEDGGLSNAKVAKEIAYKLSRAVGGKARAAQKAAQRAAQAKHNVQPSSSSSFLPHPDPLTPTNGGPDLSGGQGADRGGQADRTGPRDAGTSPRAAGTNPRAVAAAEAELLEAAENDRRLELVRRLDPDASIGGTYSGGLGFRLWNKIKTTELDELVAKRELGSKGTGQI